MTGKRKRSGQVKKCPNKGCQVKIGPSQLEHHLTCCLYRPVTCGGCGKKTNYWDLYLHQKVKNCMEVQMKKETVLNARRSHAEVMTYVKEKERRKAGLKQDCRKAIRQKANERVGRKPDVPQGYAVRFTPRSSRMSSAAAAGRDAVDAGQPGQTAMITLVEVDGTGDAASGLEVLMCKLCEKPFINARNHQSACKRHVGVRRILNQLNQCTSATCIFVCLSPCSCPLDNIIDF